MGLSALVPALAQADVTVAYVTAVETVMADGRPVSGLSRVTTTIAGPLFRIESRGRTVERSDDDGRTTYFDSAPATPQRPLDVQAEDPFAPLLGSRKDETMVIGASAPGPTLHGMPTRIYDIDYRYTTVARVAYVIHRETVSHARFTMTVADLGVSTAALRVALSRGPGHAIAQHPEAFTGLPLIIDGTIESERGNTRIHVEAEHVTQ